MPTIAGRMYPQREQTEDTKALIAGGEPEPARHDVRIGCRPGGELYAACEPCGWSIWLQGGHTPDDLKRLERQHTGETTR